MSACDPCTRRSWLIGRLATHLELCRGARTAVREVLALADDELVRALAGNERERIEREREALDPQATRERWAASGARAACRHDLSYPPGLEDLSDPPAILHLCGEGDLDALLGEHTHRVAVVGARRASADGLEVARDLGRGLSVAGITVVSGMALGIDSAAHEGALQGTGRSVAVLACGPELAYPARRRPLHRELLACALVVSELPPGSTPMRWAFPARNRLIAALSEMTVIVEAAERSGSLITAEIAGDLGREIGAVPGPARGWHSAGANALLRDGACVIRGSRDVIDDVVGVLADPRPESREQLVLAELDPPLAALLAAVQAGESSLTALASRSAGAGAALAGLTELELLGLVTRMPGGRYVPAQRTG